jgi:hypothetical protein
VQHHPRHVRLDLGDLDAVVGLHRRLDHARHVGAAVRAALRPHRLATGRVGVQRAVRSGMDPGFRAGLAFAVRLAPLRGRRAGVIRRLRRRLQLLPQRRILRFQHGNSGHQRVDPREQGRVLSRKHLTPRGQSVDPRQQRRTRRGLLDRRQRKGIGARDHKQVDSHLEPQRNRNLTVAPRATHTRVCWTHSGSLSNYHFISLNSSVLSNVYLLWKICTMDTVLRHHSLKSIGADASAEMQSG